MKKILTVSVLIAAAMILIPLGVLGQTEAVTQTAAPVEATPLSDEPSQEEIFRVLNPDTGEITQVNRNDYIFGVVAAEMPALYHTEALKAQSVAAYTFALCRKNENSGKDYDITSSPLTDQNFITKEAAAQRWGENAAEYTQKIEAAVKETEGLIISYNNQPITAVYHAISSGKTESCMDVWGEDIPYLVPVISEDDRLAQGYMSEAVFTEQELIELLGADSQSAAAEPCQPLRTQSGAVKEVTLFGKTLSGSQIRQLLGLRSANFSVEISDGSYTFTVCGYGHGVGMSQNGADCMAEKGSDFKEILTHYYTGCEIEKIN